MEVELGSDEVKCLEHEADELNEMVFKRQRTIEPGNDDILEQVPSNRDECLNAIHSLSLCANRLRQDRMERVAKGEEDLVKQMEKVVLTDDGIEQTVPVDKQDECYLHAAVLAHQERTSPWLRYTKILECAISPDAEDIFVYETAMTRAALKFLRQRALQEFKYIESLPEEEVCMEDETMLHLKRVMMHRSSPPFDIQELTEDEASFFSLYLPDNDTFKILEEKNLIHMPTNGNGYTVIGPSYWRGKHFIAAERAMTVYNRIPKMVFEYDESQFDCDPKAKQQLLLADSKIGNKQATIDLTPMIRPLSYNIDPYGEIEIQMGMEEQEENQSDYDDDDDDEEDAIDVTERMKLSDDLLYLPENGSTFILS